jgi:hypothetical protein
MLFVKFRKLNKYIFRLRNGRETLEQKKEQHVYMHTNIAHARAVAIKQRPLPYFFYPMWPKKNIIEPPNYLVAGAHFSGVFVRNASETANSGTKMHHHQPYARAVHIVQSALSLGCSTHAHRKTP